MTYHGTVRAGKVELDNEFQLPDGTRVEVLPVESSPDPADGLGDEAVDTDIPDLASQHDHYIYGTPKREA